MAMEEELRECGDLSRLRERIENIEGPGSTLLDVRLRGLLVTEDRGEVTRLGEILASRFLWSRIDASGVRLAPGDQDWLNALPVGVVRDAGAKLRELANPAFTGQRPEGATPEVADRALLELYTLLDEARR